MKISAEKKTPSIRPCKYCAMDKEMMFVLSAGE